MPAVVAAVLGAAAALVWALTVPGVHGVVGRDGSRLVRAGELDRFFDATLLFVGVSVVGGLLTGLLVFRRARRNPVGVLTTLAVSALGVLIMVLLGQAVVDARFTGPGAVGVDFTAAPRIRLEGANLLGPANHPGGVIGALSSWVLVLVWPAVTAMWCLVVAALGRLDEPTESVPGVPSQELREVGDRAQVGGTAGSPGRSEI